MKQEYSRNEKPFHEKEDKEAEKDLKKDEREGKKEEIPETHHKFEVKETGMKCKHCGSTKHKSHEHKEKKGVKEKKEEMAERMRK